MANWAVSLKESYCLTGIRYIWMPWNYVDDTCHGQHSVTKSRKNTPSSEFETMFQRELLLFLETKFPYNRVQDKPAASSLPQTSPIRSTVSTWYRCVTDEHQVIAHIALYICVVYASCGKKSGVWASSSVTTDACKCNVVGLYKQINYFSRLYCESSLRIPSPEYHETSLKGYKQQ